MKHCFEHVVDLLSLILMKENYVIHIENKQVKFYFSIIHSPFVKYIPLL